MKKITLLLLTFLAVLCLTACGGSKEIKKVYVSDDGQGTVSQITVYAEGDKVTKQQTKNILDYSRMEISKDDAKALMESQNSVYDRKLSGYKYNVEYTDKEIIETIKVDFDKFDFDKGKSILEMTGDPEKGISLKTTEGMLKDSGYIEKK